MRVIFSLIYLLCLQAVAESSENIKKRDVDQGDEEICSREDNTFTYDICHNPSNPQTMFTETNNACRIGRSFGRLMKAVTRNENYLIERSMHGIENNQIKCGNTVRNLRQQNLSDRINIVSDNVDSENVYTTSYMKIARLTYLFQQLNCKLSSAIEECCLDFPSYVFQRLKNRLLSKWFDVQDECGEFIGHSHCEANTEIIIDSPMRCEDARDVIYLLLKHARDILLESLPVIDLAVMEHE